MRDAEAALEREIVAAVRARDAQGQLTIPFKSFKDALDRVKKAEALTSGKRAGTPEGRQAATAKLQLLMTKCNTVAEVHVNSILSKVVSFVTAMGEEHGSGRYPDAWSEVDLDGSGYLDRYELGRFLRRKLKVDMPDSDLSLITSHLDEDGDNRISYEEMLVCTVCPQLFACLNSHCIFS